jgi:hypothetical protein
MTFYWETEVAMTFTIQENYAFEVGKMSYPTGKTENASI